MDARALAIPAAFVSGAASSIGPCVAPRLIAVAGLTANRGRSEAMQLIGFFVFGLVVAYAALGAAASLLGSALRFAGLTYAVVAAGLAAAGVVTLLREGRSCAHNGALRAGSRGATFLLGGSFAFVLSPCCTPVIAGIIAYVASTGEAARGSLLLASFAFGHALPVLAVGAGLAGARKILSSRSLERAANVVSGTLMIALAGYYGLLA